MSSPVVLNHCLSSSRPPSCCPPLQIPPPSSLPLLVAFQRAVFRWMYEVSGSSIRNDVNATSPQVYQQFVSSGSIVRNDIDYTRPLCLVQAHMPTTISLHAYHKPPPAVTTLNYPHTCLQFKGVSAMMSNKYESTSHQTCSSTSLRAPRSLDGSLQTISIK
jgi:hypothetical protein